MTMEPASTRANRINSDILDWSYIGISVTVGHSTRARRAGRRSTARSPSTPDRSPQTASATPAQTRPSPARANACVWEYAPPDLHDPAAARVLVFRMRDAAGRAPWQSSALAKGDQPALRLTQRRRPLTARHA